MFSGKSDVGVTSMIVNNSISTFSDFNGWETLRLLVARWSPVRPFLLPPLPHPRHCGSSVLIVRRSRPHAAAVQGCLFSVALVYLGAGVRVWCCVPDLLHLSTVSVGLLAGRWETGLLVLLVRPVWSTLLSVEWRPAALPLLCGPVGPGCAAVLHSLAPHQVHWDAAALLFILSASHDVRFGPSGSCLFPELISVYHQWGAIISCPSLLLCSDR